MKLSVGWSPTEPGPHSDGSGLSAGGKAGIAITVLICIGALAVGGFVYHRRGGGSMPAMPSLPSLKKPNLSVLSRRSGNFENVENINYDAEAVN